MSDKHIIIINEKEIQIVSKNVQGPVGPRGNTVLSGADLPTDDVGNNGDFYMLLDTAGLPVEIFGPKAAGAWPVTGTDLQGGVEAANGIPSGGTTGQFLIKSSGVDFAASWHTLASLDITTALGFTPLNTTTGDARYSQLGHAHTLADISDAGDLAAKNTIAGSDIDSATITYAKIQNVTGNRLLGRVNTNGEIQELTLGTGLSFSGSTLNAAVDNIFKTISVSGQSDIVADSDTDTLTIVAGSGITITTNATTDTLTINTSITQFNTEDAQDAIGAMVDTTLVYVDGTPLLTRAALTGDVTASQGSNTTTLATVNSNVGAFGGASKTLTATANAKGLITAIAETTIAITASQVSDFSEAVDDRVATLVQNGSNISWTYSDVSNTLTGDVSLTPAFTSLSLNATTNQIVLDADATFTGTISMATLSGASKTWTFPNTTGTVALTSDITGTNSGTNTGDQTSIVGITGTKAQFDTAVTDGNILFVGDITQYTDELAQDAIGAMVDSSLTYVDGTPLLQRAALTGDVTAAAGSNTLAIASGVIINDDINASAAIAYSKLAALTFSRALVSDGTGVVTVATTTATEIGYVNGVTSAIQTQLDAKVDENAGITGATKTKITYDAKGLVTSGADATTADIADSLDKRYVTDANLTVIGNTSGTNTGDQLTFKTIAVSGQSDVVADTITDTLTLVAGSGITITTNATTDEITITSTGGYTNEDAQDAIGAMIDTTLVYVDGTPLLTRAALTGDITAAQGSNATTLATVNSNVGSFGGAGSVGTFTVNAKGLITAASDAAISITASQVSDFSEATDDRVAALIQNGSNISWTYSDVGNTLTGDVSLTPTFTSLSLTADTNQIVLDSNGTFTGTLSMATLSGSSKTWTLPNTTGTIALTSDITGTNSGTNTGDQNLFSTIAVSGQSNIVADSTSDTLTLIAGTNVTITTNATNDEITINSTGSGGNSFETIAVSGQSNVVADSSTDTLTLVAGTGMTITTDAGTDTITINSSITQYTDELAQDAIGSILLNGGGITWTYDDATPNISAVVSIASTSVTDFTEAAQDAIGAMIDTTLTYVDGTPLLQRAAISGDITIAAGSNSAAITSDVIVNGDINSAAAIAYSKLAALTVSRALVSDGSGVVSVATTTATELGYVNGVTSAIQTQLNAKAATTQTGAFTLFVETVANKDYILSIKTPFAGTIVNATTRSASGTATATFKVNTTALGGSANSVSSAEETQAHASTNTFAAGDDIVCTISSNSTCLDFRASLEFTRTLS